MKNENEWHEKFYTYISIFLRGGKTSTPPNVKIKRKPQLYGKVMRERIIRLPLIYYFQFHYEQNSHYDVQKVCFTYCIWQSYGLWNCSYQFMLRSNDASQAMISKRAGKFIQIIKILVLEQTFLFVLLE